MPYGVCKACSWIVEKQARSCTRCGQSRPFDYTKLIPAHVLDEARHCFKELDNISASVARVQQRHPHLDSNDLASALAQSLEEDHSRIVAQPRKSLELTSLHNPRDVRAWHATLKYRPVCVVVDIETSGLIINKVMPRIVQLAWCVVTLEKQILEKRSYLVQPVGFQISEGSRRKHQITQEMALLAGKPIQDVLREFDANLRQHNVKVCVGHNLHEFDYPIIKNEYGLNNIGPDFFTQLSRLCTMRFSVEITRIERQGYASRVKGYKKKCDLRNRRNRNRFEAFKSRLEPLRLKYPTLDELHRYLTGKYSLNLHDAAADVAACAECFLILAEYALEHGARLEVEDQALADEQERLEAARRAAVALTQSEAARRPWWKFF